MPPAVSRQFPLLRWLQIKIESDEHIFPPPRKGKECFVTVAVDTRGKTCFLLKRGRGGSWAQLRNMRAYALCPNIRLAQLSIFRKQIIVYI